MTDKNDLKKRESEAIFPTYGRQDVVLVRGSGVKVWDSGGKEYLDFVAGIAVNNVATATRPWSRPSASRPVSSFIPPTSTTRKSRCSLRKS